MKNKLSSMLRHVALAGAVLSAPLAFGQFINGGFEAGDFTGWTRGSGFVYQTNTTTIDPNGYLPAGAYFNASYDASAVVTSYLDANTDNKLNSVYSGMYSARVNNSLNDYSASVISQSVKNYTDAHIFFAWAAVLEASHGLEDSDLFSLTLKDDTTGSTIYSVSYSSASADSLFTESLSGWFYTQWQIQDIDVSALSGHDFTLTLAGLDCPYGGHAGYVYLDGFGAQIPPVGESAVPEPSTYGMLGAMSLLGLVGYRRFGKKTGVKPAVAA